MQVAGAIAAEPGMKQQTYIAFDTYNQTVSGDTTQTLCSRGDTPGGNAHLVPAIAFSCKDHGADAGAVAPTLRSMGHNNSHANAGGQLAVAFDITGSDPTVRSGGAETDVHTPLRARSPGGSEGSTTTVVTFSQNQAGDVLTGEVMHSLQTNSNATGRSSPNVMTNWAVRRLTPTECERLQGFPDGYTNVPWRGKASTPDGPRYKALGNSMAVNCMRWIGMRIQLVSDIAKTVPKTNHRLAS